MSLKEQTIILTDKDCQGNTIMQFPITKAKNIEDVMSIAQGGTGATTVAGARNALGLGNTTGALPIANGGTGADNLTDAKNNLGINECLNIGLLNNLTQIPKNADFNNYTTAGNYACASGNIASTLKNAPPVIGGSFRLVVMKAFANFITQIIFTTNYRGHWTRMGFGSGDDIVWEDWVNMTAIKNCVKANSGYILLGGIADNLVLAWTRATIGKASTKVTKPIPFTTYATVASDYGTVNDGVYPPKWISGSTSNTADYYQGNVASNAICIFWLGEVG